MANYRIENITGASFSGSAGTGRTYTLAYSDPSSAAFFVQVQGVLLTQFFDFTISGNVLTINTYLANGDIVVLNYLTDVSGASSSGTSYTTADLVRAEIRGDVAFTSTTEPTLAAVSNWIIEESRNIDKHVGLVFSDTTVSSVVVDYDGDTIFRFPQLPLISITSVEYNQNNNNEAASWTTLQSGYGYNYIEYLDEGEIEFVHGNLATYTSPISPGKKRLRLTYHYGYATVPETIQKLATLMVTRRVISTLVNSQANTEGGSIQVGTIRVTDPSNFSVGYIKNLNQDINDTLNSIGENFKTYRVTRRYD